MNKTMMKRYAKAIVAVGAHVQKNQDVVIRTSTRLAEFTTYVVEECYKKGARTVTVDWGCDEIRKLDVKYQTVETMSDIPNWRLEKLKDQVEKLPAFIYIDDSDPDGMKNIDMKKVMQARMKTYPLMKPFHDQMDNKYQWVIAAMPSMDWAKKVFPNDKPKVAFKKLEEAILFTARINHSNNPVKDWRKHIETLHEKADKMNAYQFDYLKYKSSNGTDLTVHLVKNHIWLSAEETTIGRRKVNFTANMPTEEVFTMPAYEGVDGVVYSTKPLSLHGKICEDFKVEFEKGRVTKVTARVGQENLEEMLSMDEGSKHLGEVALVPWNSPINETGVLFYNTLFDENATCHLAFGMAFKNNVQGYETMTEEDWKKVPYNDSMNHVDFMVGAPDLSIVGVTHDGKEVQVFKDGTWAI